MYLYTAQGHAFEARVYAEIPEHDFMPAVGTILRWQTPGGASAFEFNTSGVRIDSGVQPGDEVGAPYMLARLL